MHINRAWLSVAGSKYQQQQEQKTASRLFLQAIL